jgi:hypothetical protein
MRCGRNTKRARKKVNRHGRSAYNAEVESTGVLQYHVIERPAEPRYLYGTPAVALLPATEGSGQPVWRHSRPAAPEKSETDK